MRAFDVQRRRSGSTRTEVAVVMLVTLTIVALLLPATVSHQDRGGRGQAISNLKLIGLASHSFFDANKRLPFNGVAQDTQQNGEQYFQTAQPSIFKSGSWGFQISSYMDQGPMFLQGTSTNGVAAFMEPGRGRPGANATPNPWSDYIINPWLNDDKAGNFALNFDNKRTLVEITDGTSFTIFFGQGAVNPSDYGKSAVIPGYLDTILKGGTGATAQLASSGFARDSAATPQNAERGWGGPYQQGCLMCMCDATVRMFPYSLGAAGLQPFMTPNGKENVELPDT
jgi:hypothetical protein